MRTLTSSLFHSHIKFRKINFEKHLMVFNGVFLKAEIVWVLLLGLDYVICIRHKGVASIFENLALHIS